MGSYADNWGAAKLGWYSNSMIHLPSIQTHPGGFRAKSFTVDAWVYDIVLRFPLANEILECRCSGCSIFNKFFAHEVAKTLEDFENSGGIFKHCISRIENDAFDCSVDKHSLSTPLVKLSEVKKYILVYTCWGSRTIGEFPTGQYSPQQPSVSLSIDHIGPVMQIKIRKICLPETKWACKNEYNHELANFAKVCASCCCCWLNSARPPSPWLNWHRCIALITVDGLTCFWAPTAVSVYWRRHGLSKNAYEQICSTLLLHLVCCISPVAFPPPPPNASHHCSPQNVDSAKVDAAGPGPAKTSEQSLALSQVTHGTLTDM